MNGFRTSLDVAGPVSLTLGYVADPAGRLATITRSGSEVAHYTYDLFGRRTRLDHRLGASTIARTESDFDDASRLTEIRNFWGTGSISTFNYANYDDVGNYRARTVTRPPLPVENRVFGYDLNMDRLLTVTDGATPLETFGFDLVGNRTTYKPGLGPTETWTYLTANRLLSDSTWTYSHDLNGNVTSKSSGPFTFNFNWNHDNQLQSLTTGATTIGTAKYDAFGRRIEKTWGATGTAKYLYDGADIIAELDGAGAVRATWVHGAGIDEPLIMNRGGQDYRYFSDILGSVREIVGPTGLVRNRYDYDAFGATYLSGTMPVENPFAYTGREWEKDWLVGVPAEKSPYYYRARYYDPGVGRFLSEDPIGFGGGDLNLFSYVRASPLLHTAPTGEAAPVVGIIIAGAIVVGIIRYIYNDYYKEGGGEAIRRMPGQIDESPLCAQKRAASLDQCMSQDGTTRRLCAQLCGECVSKCSAQSPAAQTAFDFDSCVNGGRPLRRSPE